MTKQEVKEEYKNQEGKPEVKAGSVASNGKWRWGKFAKLCQKPMW